MSIDFLESVSMAVRLSANKMRSSLTMLGIIIQCLVIAMVSVVREPGGLSISNFSPWDKSAVRGAVWRKVRKNRRVQ